jgi:hypothetical protein
VIRFLCFISISNDLFSVNKTRPRGSSERFISSSPIWSLKVIHLCGSVVCFLAFVVHIQMRRRETDERTKRVSRERATDEIYVM